MKKLLCSLLVLLCGFYATAQDSTLTAYTGTYHFPSGSVTSMVTISVQNGALYANSTIGAAALERVQKDTFSIPDYNAMVYFFRSENGTVKSIRIEVEDLVLEGEREQPSGAFLHWRQPLMFTKQQLQTVTP